MSRLRVGVVGCTRGRHHADGYTLVKDRAQLVWVADINEHLAKQTAEKLDCEYTTDWESRLDDVDAVSIATPHHLHAPQTIRAMNAGKHVLVEKPLATSEEECLRMAEAAKANGVCLMSAYQLRYWPAVRWVKEALEENRFGPLINIACWTHAKRPPLGSGRSGTKAELGGGALFSHGCHYIDLMIYFLGTPVDVATLGTRLGTEWLDGEGTAQAIMRFPSGALGHYEISWGCAASKLMGQMHLYFPDSLVVLHIGGRVDLVTKKSEEVLFEARDITGPWHPGENTIDQIQHFLDSIEQGKEPLTSPHEALKSLRTIWRMYDQEPSAETERRGA